jgi:chromosome segregation ATPase
VGGQPAAIYDCAVAAPPIESRPPSINLAGRRTGAPSSALLSHVSQFIAEYDDLRSAHDELQNKHTQVGADREQISARLGKASDELTTALATIEHLTKALGERDHTIESQRNEFSAEIGAVREALFAAKQKDLEETEALKTEMDALFSRYQQVCEDHRTAQALCADHEAKNRSLAAMNDRLLAEALENALAADNERQRLVDEINELRANAEDTARAAEAMIAAARSEPSVRLASAEEIEVARTQIGGQRWDLLPSEGAGDVVVETLESLGASTQLPGKPPTRFSKAGK